MSKNLTKEQHAFERLIAGEYRQACDLYQQAIEMEPELRSNYWYLGLALLLQGQEAEAQVTWMLVMGEGDEEQVEQWTAELVEVLQTAANRLEELADWATAWAIRQHVREIDPSDINNLLKIVQLSLQQERLTEEALRELEIIKLLTLEPKTKVDPDLLMQVLQLFLDKAPLDPLLPEFVEACLPNIGKSAEFTNILMSGCIKIALNLKRPDQAIVLTKLALHLNPDNLEAWRHLAAYYQSTTEYNEGIEAAKKCYDLAQNLPDKVFANYLLLRGLMNAGGYWEEAVSVNDRQESLMLSLNQEEVGLVDIVTTFRLYTSAYFFPYFRDNPKKNRTIHNQLAEFCQSRVEFHARELVERCRKRHLSRKVNTATSKPLKIGYLSHCLGTHSVGWLSRWLFEYHDREKYDIYGYFVNYRSEVEDPLQRWFAEHMSYARKLGMNYFEVAEQIYQDDIDILVDLDSVTLDVACGVMAMKPSPIQVVWLGWDAPGIPTIDYMIADPYVLPENAGDYYREKIWRLPQTYIAVDGFEVAVPTLRRDHLEIPSDAVVYLSAQRGYKRHLDTARLQMKIIKEVANSYFLIKGYADQEVIKKFFLQIAEEEGVSGDRLRFLPSVPSEAVHRANLGLADVVLDTYPYNGATTTLETLWMGVPLVTRVGKQFAARNSYAMMMNAGIAEGIAWNDEEYVEWGVRLGKDPQLRQQISWRLRQSRQTSPLWNAKQFAREMEKAYEQMWLTHTES